MKDSGVIGWGLVALVVFGARLRMEVNCRTFGRNGAAEMFGDRPPVRCRGLRAVGVTRSLASVTTLRAAHWTIVCRTRALFAMAVRIPPSTKAPGL